MEGSALSAKLASVDFMYRVLYNVKASLWGGAQGSSSALGRSLGWYKEAMMKIWLSGRVREGEHSFFAFCQQLPIVTSGATEEEAIENMSDAAREYLSVVREVDHEHFESLLVNLVVDS